MTTRAQRRTQDDTRPHKHACKIGPFCGGDPEDRCLRRGYHECKCGATKGIAETSSWIKSRATDGSTLRRMGWL